MIKFNSEVRIAGVLMLSHPCTKKRIDPLYNQIFLLQISMIYFDIRHLFSYGELHCAMFSLCCVLMCLFFLSFIAVQYPSKTFALVFDFSVLLWNNFDCISSIQAQETELRLKPAFSNRRICSREQIKSRNASYLFAVNFFASQFLTNHVAGFLFSLRIVRTNLPSGKRA